MVNLDGIVDLDAAAAGAQIAAHPAGVHPDGQGAVGRVIHGQVPPALLKDHLGVDLPHPQQGDPVGLDLEGGQGALQSGELALLIGQGIALVAVGLQAALGDQLNGVVLLGLEGLLSLDGNDDVVLHGDWYLGARCNENCILLYPTAGRM